MHQFIQQIRFRKKVATYLIISFALLIAVGFFYLTASETWFMGVEKLGEDRYTARMNDSYLYAALLSLMALPLILALNPFFKGYIRAVNTLSKSEMERLEKQNETAPFFNKYLPGFIAKDKSILFFKFFKTTEISYFDITKISLGHAKGGYYLRIKTKTSFFIGLMAESYPTLLRLIEYAKEVNPKIDVSLP
jgi:hypothetical protein